MRVWLDLSNSPHPLLFAPIARRLEALGHEVLVTARDNAQTVELTHERWPDAAIIGGPSPGGRARKGLTLARRVTDLAAWARRHRPDVALSHNSYAQIAAARMTGVRALTAMDFEHQPANHVGFRLAHTVLLPRALEDTEVRRQGARKGKTRFYDGLKEEVYLGDFTPDPGVVASLGIERGSRLVVARTAPSRALYHRFGNPLLEDALRTLAQDPGTRIVVLTRHPEQREAITGLGLPNLVVPERAVDSRSLMWEADLVLGAGGTMTREAALLGVPTFSLFAGEQPAVDRWLIERGMLRMLERPEQVADVTARSRDAAQLVRLRERADELARLFADCAVSAARPAARLAEPQPVGAHG